MNANQLAMNIAQAINAGLQTGQMKSSEVVMVLEQVKHDLLSDMREKAQLIQKATKMPPEVNGGRG